MPQPSLFRGFKNGGPTIFERTIFERVLDIIRIKIRHLKGEKQMGKLWNIRFIKRNDINPHYPGKEIREA